MSIIIIIIIYSQQHIIIIMVHLEHSLIFRICMNFITEGKTKVIITIIIVA